MQLIKKLLKKEQVEGAMEVSSLWTAIVVKATNILSAQVNHVSKVVNILFDNLSSYVNYYPENKNSIITMYDKRYFRLHWP